MFKLISGVLSVLALSWFAFALADETAASPQQEPDTAVVCDISDGTFSTPAAMFAHLAERDYHDDYNGLNPNSTVEASQGSARELSSVGHLIVRDCSTPAQEE